MRQQPLHAPPGNAATRRRIADEIRCRRVRAGFRGVYRGVASRQLHLGAGWTRLSTLNVEWLGVYADKLVADFGAAYGLWQFDGAAWSQLSSANPENLTTGNTMVDFSLD